MQNTRYMTHALEHPLDVHLESHSWRTGAILDADVSELEPAAAA